MLRVAHGWRDAFGARSRREPGRPVGPPTALVARGTLEPLLGAACRGIAGFPYPVCTFAAGRIDDPCDMAAGSAYKPDVAAEQLRDAPRRVPGHNVVFLRTDSVSVQANAPFSLTAPGLTRLFSR